VAARYARKVFVYVLPPSLTAVADVLIPGAIRIVGAAVLFAREIPFARTALARHARTEASSVLEGAALAFVVGILRKLIIA
jgi:hypothetical protein